MRFKNCFVGDRKCGYTSSFFFNPTINYKPSRSKLLVLQIRKCDPLAAECRAKADATSVSCCRHIRIYYLMLTSVNSGNRSRPPPTHSQSLHFEEFSPLACRLQKDVSAEGVRNNTVKQSSTCPCLFFHSPTWQCCPGVQIPYLLSPPPHLVLLRANRVLRV